MDGMEPVLRGATGGVEKPDSGLDCTDFGIFGNFKIFHPFG
jgi:hypothetical protein